MMLLLILAAFLGSKTVSPVQVDGAQLPFPGYGRPIPPNVLRVFVAKKIYTQDDGIPVAQYVAVRDGRVVTVGETLSDLAPWLSVSNWTLDTTLRDKIVLPGFIDPHTHPFGAAYQLFNPLLTYFPTALPCQADFPGVKTKAAALQAIADAIARHNANYSFYAWGWDIVYLNARATRQELDAISATIPIVINDASSHEGFANTIALNRSGLLAPGAATKYPGLTLDANGQPTGRVQADALNHVLGWLVPLTGINQAEVARRTIAFFLQQQTQGVTTTNDAALGGISGTVAGDVGLYKSLFSNPDVALRLTSFPQATVLAKDASLNTTAKRVTYLNGLKANLSRDTNGKLLYYGALKWFADDGYGALSFQLGFPGFTTDEYKSYWLTPPDRLYTSIEPYWDNNLKPHVHNTGDLGAKGVIDVLQKLQDHKPRFNHRFSFEHYGVTTQEDARALKDLGAVASVQPYYIVYRSNATAKYIGQEKAFLASRFKSLVDNDVTFTLHDDAPIAPPSPLLLASAAVNRVNAFGRLVGGPQRISVERALRAITIDAAYVLGAERDIGSIYPGKFADFAVLESDPYRVRPNQLGSVRVWGTVSGGVPRSNVDTCSVYKSKYSRPVSGGGTGR